MIEYYKKLEESIYWVDGKPYWKYNMSPLARQYQLAGTFERYRRIRVRLNNDKGKLILAHHLRWFMQFGVIPKMLDHINHNTDENFIHNLRECTSSQNNRNKRSHGASKYLGVTWFKKAKKWGASIRVEGKKVHLGCFAEEIDAAQAYDDALRKFGLEEFGNFNLVKG